MKNRTWQSSDVDLPSRDQQLFAKEFLPDELNGTLRHAEQSGHVVNGRPAPFTPAHTDEKVGKSQVANFRHGAFQPLELLPDLVGELDFAERIAEKCEGVELSRLVVKVR